MKFKQIKNKRSCVRYLSTISVFCIGILITYFLSDFYNDIEDDNRTNFSKEESNTLVNYIDASIDGEEREYTISNALSTFPNMTLSDYRNIGALPGKPPLILSEKPPGTGLDAFIFIRRVFHEDRESFEEKMSLEYNETLKINDYNTQVTVEERDVYWPVFYHIVTAKIIGGDLFTEPGRLSALNNILKTGQVSYSPPVLSVSRGTTSFLKIYDVVTTPEGDLGVMSLFVNLQRVVEIKTNVLDFLDGGNGGRRIVINQIQDGIQHTIYERGSSPDLIYEKYLPKTDQTTFVIQIYDDEHFDNTEATLIFMGIGLLVSLALAGWEWFRSGSSIKSEETSEAKSKFLANISHEIRTPINGIVGISDVLSKENLPPLPKSYVDIIVSCSTSLISLLNNVLDMSKIDAGKMENNKKQFVLRTMVLTALRDSWGVVHAKNPKLERIYALFTESVPCIEVYGNETHIFQILNNLVSNASKFTDEGYIEVKMDAKEGKRDKEIDIYLSIRDTGCGMDETAVKKLFKPFSQVHNSNNSKDGTGLGLVISMKLAKLMGGGITCESQVGVGTTFTAKFTIPGTLREDNSDPEIVVFDEKHKIDDDFIGIKKEVRAVDVVVREDAVFLVVDDNKTNQMVMTKMLECIGTTNVDVTGDGKDAVNITMNKKYDIIFMDKFMPVMDGIEATRTIRTDSKNKCHKSPIVFLSADTQDESISKCIKAGANEFIGKPYRMDLLIDTIYRIDKSLLSTVMVQ